MDEGVKLELMKSVTQEMEDLFKAFSKEKEAAAALKEPWFFKIWDLDQKCFVLTNKTLVAVPKGSNSSEELLTVVPNTGTPQADKNIFPIFMGLQDGKHVLSCAESGGRPQLQIADEDIMNLYQKNEPLKTFTFLNHTGGSNQETCSFESAAFPGWFISTSSEANKPISLEREGGAAITTFYFKKS
ncbi:interleukin-36 alpha-like isoform X2 [Sceloporus undulatus]|uniref:interleukin-36 alpha-like isoform X2 n=1 Tax=Sceloporus undulatus TaxID=8520 RepID=UPI001C4AA07C|nr:interleukin-36 alpha-like isoform X2 [Sceloporus undulatus]